MLKDNSFFASINNGKWVFLANLAQSILSFSILMVLIRLGSKEDVGVFSYIQAIFLPVHLFFSLKLRTIECSDVTEAYQPSTYHVVRMLCSKANLFLGLFLTLTLLEPEQYFVGIALLISYSFLIIRESYGSNFLKKRQGWAFFLVNASNATFSILAFSLSFYLYRDLLTSLVALLFARIVSYFLVEKIVAIKVFGKDILKEYDFRKIKKEVPAVVKLGVPLGLTALLGALFTSIPRFLVEAMDGVAALAIFSTVTSLNFAINIFVNSYVQAMLPEMAKLYIDNRKEHVKKILVAIFKIILAGTILGISASLIGERFLGLVFGDQYSEYVFELVCAVFSASALGIFSIGNLMLSSQKSYFVQLPLYALVVFAITVSVYFGVKWLGLPGAIAGQGLGYLAGFIGCCMFFYRRKNWDA